MVAVFASEGLTSREYVPHIEEDGPEELTDLGTTHVVRHT